MPDFEVKSPDYDQMLSVGQNELQVSWLGHASVLFQIGGVNILSDPVFSKICGPIKVKGVGSQRFRDCRVDVGKLPDIHVVMISHDHYDHLDRQTVSRNHITFQHLCFFLEIALPVLSQAWVAVVALSTTTNVIHGID